MSDQYDPACPECKHDAKSHDESSTGCWHDGGRCICLRSREDVLRHALDEAMNAERIKNKATLDGIAKIIRERDEAQEQHERQTDMLKQLLAEARAEVERLRLQSLERCCIRHITATMYPEQVLLHCEYDMLTVGVLHDECKRIAAERQRIADAVRRLGPELGCGARSLADRIASGGFATEEVRDGGVS